MKRLSATLALVLLAGGLGGCAYHPGSHAGYSYGYGYAPRHYSHAPIMAPGYARPVGHGYAPPAMVYAPPHRFVYPAAVAPVRIQAHFGIGRGWGGHGGWGWHGRGHGHGHGHSHWHGHGHGRWR